MTDDLERAHREAAELLGLDPDRLTPAGRLKCEVVSALRAVVDDQLSRVTRANATDLGKLVAAVEQLTHFMKESPSGDQDADEDDDGEDPRETLMRIVENWIAADAAARAERGLSGLMPDLPSAQARIDELEAEIARLRGEDPKSLPAPESERVITPSESDIVPSGELGESYAGKRLTPDDHRVMRPKPVIEGTAEPVATVDGKPVPPGSRTGLPRRRPSAQKRDSLG